MAEYGAVVMVTALWAGAMGGRGVTIESGAPTPVQPADGLQLVAVDSSRSPLVTIDLAVPDREAVETLGVDAFRVDGGEVVSATRLDPAELVVGLVLDDGAGVPQQMIMTEQGAAVELVRNIDAGTQVAVGATSGVAAPPSADRAFVINTIATVGAKPAGGPRELLEALSDTASGLPPAGPRRHLIALVGDEPLSAADVAPLRDGLERSGVSLHVVSVGTRLDPMVTGLAADTQGSASAPGPNGFLAAVDALTGGLTGQYRLEVRVTQPGSHNIELEVDSRKYQTTVDLAPTATEAPTSAGEATSTLGASTPALGGSTAPVDATESASATGRRATSAAGDRQLPTVLGVAAAALAIVAALVTIILVRRRRRGGTAVLPDATPRPAVPVAVEPPDPDRWEDDQWDDQRGDDEGWIDEPWDDDLEQLELAEPVTVRDWFEAWWPTVVDQEAGAAARDERYARTYVLPILGPIAIDRLDEPTLVAWITALGKPEAGALNPAAVHRIARILNGCLDAAVDEGLIPDNPAANLPLPEIERDDMRILTDDEIWRLAEAMHPRYRPIVLLAAFCGLRLGELLALRWGQVDLVDGQLRVVETMTERDGNVHIGPPKAKATVRSVPLPHFVVESLAQLPMGADADTLVFGSSDNHPLRPGVFRRRYWSPAVDEAGLGPLRVRDLRDTAVAIWIAESAHPEQIVTLAGISSIDVLFRLYGHLYREPTALVSALEGRAGRRGDEAVAHEEASAEPLLEDSSARPESAQVRR